MRYAIFADIHSNLEAYEAVLAEISKEEVDGYCCLGDIVGYGADYAACIAKTRNLGAHIVAGNHDWAAAGIVNTDNFTPNAKAAVLWTADALSEEEKDYLRTLPLTYGNNFFLVHGSPNRPQEFEYIFGLNDAYAAFLRMQESQMRICFVGHTHAAGVFIEDLGYITYNPWPQVKIEENKRYIVNVGSVGQPRDSDPRAAYCIYDTDANIVEIKRVDYDIAGAQRKIIKAGLPKILAERLSWGK